MDIPLKKVLKIIAEILLLIAEHIPLKEAISSTALKFNVSELDVWNIWNNR